MIIDVFYQLMIGEIRTSESKSKLFLQRATATNAKSKIIVPVVVWSSK